MKFLATKGNDVGDAGVEHDAIDRADAEQKLSDGGYSNYKIVWESRPNMKTKEVVKDEDGNFVVRDKDETS